MVKLIRSIKVIGSGETAWELLSKMQILIKGYDEVSDAELMMSINGPQDEVHSVITFESLAKEEQFAQKAMKDENYHRLINEADGLFTVPTDNFYRVIPLE